MLFPCFADRDDLLSRSAPSSRPPSRACARRAQVRKYTHFFSINRKQGLLFQHFSHPFQNADNVSTFALPTFIRTNPPNDDLERLTTPRETLPAFRPRTASPSVRTLRTTARTCRACLLSAQASSRSGNFVTGAESLRNSLGSEVTACGGTFPCSEPLLLGFRTRIRPFRFRRSMESRTTNQAFRHVPPHPIHRAKPSAEEPLIRNESERPQQSCAPPLPYYQLAFFTPGIKP